MDKDKANQAAKDFLEALGFEATTVGVVTIRPSTEPADRELTVEVEYIGSENRVTHPNGETSGFDLRVARFDI